MLQSAQFIQYTSQWPDVRLGIVAVVLQYLRTHVVGCACERGGQVRGSHEDSGDTKVTQFDQIVLEEDVSVETERERLEVIVKCVWYIANVFLGILTLCKYSKYLLPLEKNQTRSLHAHIIIIWELKHQR